MRRVLLAGGGTGGHLAIVAALKEALPKLGAGVYYAGSESGQDRSWFGEDDAFAGSLFLPTRGVVNQKALGRLAALGAIAAASVKARRFLRDNRVDGVVSVGGYSAAPAALAAITGGVPLLIHEQNAAPGRLNRLLRPFARRFFSSYEGERVDYPVREAFFAAARPRERVERVVFLGGSQGARAINDLALALAPRLAEAGIGIIHQTGRREWERVKEAYDTMGVAADCFPFHPALHEKIAAADFAISRAGASTLWELAANRLPALFIPYPYAAGDHQYHNARYLAERGAGWVVRQEALTPDLAWERLQHADVAAASSKLAELVRPGGAETLARKILEAL
ncbi:UDP-N-acetylglucosamine--N-acetylmuramyl-(pentapeptide) pyrophosphoryl-undecaprenol N-acetylglucosamine transferase [Hydrogenimonas sp.]